MELPPEIYANIERLSDDGNDLFDNEDYSGAIARWDRALALVPDPKTEWEASTWLYASIGEARYKEGSLDLAREALFDALNCPDGQVNPLVHYRLGQCQIKLGDEKGGIEHLLSAYMLAGEDVFEDDEGEFDGREYLNLLKNRGLI
jgi:tetratricopeptide (TPR) repeat protein